MENKDNESIIIIGIHVHDIKWEGLNPSEQAYLPLETNLPFKGEYYYGEDDEHRQAVEDALEALCGFKPSDFSMDYEFLDDVQVRNNNDGFFTVTRVHRDDLKSRGFKVDNVSDEDMCTLARRMENAYLENEYWDDLEIVADAMGIPRDEE